MSLYKLYYDADTYQLFLCQNSQDYSYIDRSVKVLVVSVLVPEKEATLCLKSDKGREH